MSLKKKLNTMKITLMTLRKNENQISKKSEKLNR